MKQTLRILLVLIIMMPIACKPKTLDQVQGKWGPPGKIVETETTTTWFYYFHKATGKAWSPGVIGFGSGSSGIVVYEMVADKAGDIKSFRKYWKQPELQPNKTVID